jgi:chemotaxis protein histidine kinase CheA
MSKSTSLSIVAVSAVEQLGGSVAAKSELDKGSSFTIKLPKRI